jgi:hypothetical protein
LVLVVRRLIMRFAAERDWQAQMDASKARGVYFMGFWVDNHRAMHPVHCYDGSSRIKLSNS